MKCRRQGLVAPLSQIAGFETFIEQLRQTGKGKVLHTVDACKPHLTYALSTATVKNPIILTTDELSGKKLYEDMQFLYDQYEVYLYPARDILFYNADVHSMDITAERMKIIEALLTRDKVMVIIPAEALLNPLSPKETWRSYERAFKEAQVVDLKELTKYLLETGYERVAKVEGIGQFVLRGGILDIYPPNAEVPYRIEFWDDEIDSIRTFNPATQRSIDRVEKIKICPNQEVIFPFDLLRKAVPTIKSELKQIVSELKNQGRKESASTLEAKVKEDIEQIEEGIVIKGLETYVPFMDLHTVTILDYIPKESLIVVDEPTKLKDKCERLYEEYQESMKDRLEYGHILPTQIEFIMNYEQVERQIEHRQSVYLMNFEGHNTPKISNVLSLDVYENNTFYKSLDLLEKDLRAFKQENKKVILLGGLKVKAMRLMEELEARGIYTTYSEDGEMEVKEGQIVIMKGALNKGFTYQKLGFVIIADKDLFGKEKKQTRTKKKIKGTKIDSYLDLSPGDYVVHENHGIGVFKGVEQIVVEGIARDNLKIEYQGDSTLYININQMDMVQKYVGAEGKPPKLSKLGTSEWKKSKTKVKGAVQDIAKDLIKLYSQRQTQRGFQYEEDSLWQKEFEQMFPYEETSDQIEAIEDTKQDMESGKIMDRLVCGDVGFGKTEVAIRAAFKAVQNNKQVAYLVPTTILAQQHYQRFVERMANYPVNVGVLSRFRTAKQIKATIEGIRKGSIDIVIGTHRLLSKDVDFKDLGLVIIDEEQRFGVKHKERLKEMRTEVDVLTLTATPIPRTLHMSLIGVRDMSVLEEAPGERRPVQTYVMEYSDDFIKDAIHRELSRGGQVYFLHNQVKDIEDKALQIQKMVPDAQVAFAHGQMSERELENMMLAFMNQEIDILVCTTIIETGLDIANANTIIMDNADHMGLSQLYQLRGRVGRSNKVAYAYLMYQKNKVLKEVAEKRLQAIKQFTQLGAGYKIAMRDLEIRGAGNLLGARQHGHMEAIGYDLYCKMLKEAVAMEKGEKVKEVFETAIEIKISAYLPSDYIEEEVQRLDIYKRIASIETEKDYYDVQEEIEDRYGTLPQNVLNLLQIALIKAMANDIEISLVSEQNKEIVFKFKENADLDPSALPDLIALYPRKMRFVATKEAMLRVDTSDVNKKEILSYIKSILQVIKKLKKTAK